MNYEQVIIDVLSEHGIEYWTEGKNVSSDTINVNCPFCAMGGPLGPDPSNHCGIFKETMKFNCWRCNKKGSFAFLVAILTHSKLEYCERMIQDMGVFLEDDPVSQVQRMLRREELSTTKEEKNEFLGLPRQFIEVTADMDFPLIDDYLERRDLYIEDLTDRKCGVCRTGPYMNRLIIPVYEDRELVAFQAADMTGRAMVKYKNSDNDMDYLYGLDDIREDGLMVLTEGLMDQWRVNEHAVCTFGASITEKQQTRIIDSKVQQLVFGWDGDAYWKAREAADYFRPFIPEVYVLQLPDGEDPDSLGHGKMWTLIREAIGEEWMII